MHTYGTAHEAAGSGVLVFGIAAFYGVRLLIRGIRDDIYDDSGTKVGGRGWFIVGGLVMILPLIAFSFFAWRQGYFRS
jgi:hypothetical protein